MKSAADTRKPYRGTTRSIVIALDVGTTFSGVSYAILEPNEVPKIHGVTRFPGQEHVAGNSKIPSIMYYSKHGRLKAAGAEADSASMVSLAEDEGWTKVELFKLRLRPKTMNLKMNGMRLSSLPRKKSSVNVFGDFLGYLFLCTRNFIVDTHAGGQALWKSVENDIQFVMSHPNGWEGAQQTKMRRAAIYGGLVPDTDQGKSRIRFVTEGEASLHACVLNGLAADVLSNVDQPGFIVADAGGGTLDISSYAVRGTYPLVIEEIAPPDCIFAGSVFVSRRARAFFEEKLKNSKYGTPDALDHITKRFDETTKRLFRDKRDLQFVPFGSPLDKDLAVGIRGGQLKLTGSEVAALFEPSVEAAVASITSQIEASAGVVKSVWLVGGFAASPWLFNQLQERLSRLNVTVSRPDSQTSKAVADGAIGFYCDHHVSARMSKYMYGVEYLREFDAADDQHVQRRDRLCELPSGPKLLPDAFDCILSRSIKVKESTVFSRKYCTELVSLSTLSVFEVEIWCYRGGNVIPKWILRQAEEFSTLCVVRADLSPLSGSAQAKKSRSGKTYWTIVFSVEIHFGLTEFKARIKWVDDGVTRYGPASIVYNESGHRADEDEVDSAPEDNGTIVSRARSQDSRHHSTPPSVLNTPRTDTLTLDAGGTSEHSDRTVRRPSTRSYSYAPGDREDRASRDSLDRGKGRERDSGRDSIRDSGRESIRDPGRESIRDSGRSSIRDSPRDSEFEPAYRIERSFGAPPTSLVGDLGLGLGAYSRERPFGAPASTGLDPTYTKDRSFGAPPSMDRSANTSAGSAKSPTTEMLAQALSANWGASDPISPSTSTSAQPAAAASTPLASTRKPSRVVSKVPTPKIASPVLPEPVELTPQPMPQVLEPVVVEEKVEEPTPPAVEEPPAPPKPAIPANETKAAKRLREKGEKDAAAKLEKEEKEAKAKAEKEEKAAKALAAKEEKAAQALIEKEEREAKEKVEKEEREEKERIEKEEQAKKDAIEKEEKARLEAIEEEKVRLETLAKQEKARLDAVAKQEAADSLKLAKEQKKIDEAKEKERKAEAEKERKEAKKLEADAEKERKKAEAETDKAEKQREEDEKARIEKEAADEKLGQEEKERVEAETKAREDAELKAKEEEAAATADDEAAKNKTTDESEADAEIKKTKEMDDAFAANAADEQARKGEESAKKAADGLNTPGGAKGKKSKKSKKGGVATPGDNDIPPATPVEPTPAPADPPANPAPNGFDDANDLWSKSNTFGDESKKAPADSNPCGSLATDNNPLESSPFGLPAVEPAEPGGCNDLLGDLDNPKDEAPKADDDAEKTAEADKAKDTGLLTIPVTAVQSEAPSPMDGGETPGGDGAEDGEEKEEKEDATGEKGGKKEKEKGGKKGKGGAGGKKKKK